MDRRGRETHCDISLTSNLSRFKPLAFFETALYDRGSWISEILRRLLGTGYLRKFELEEEEDKRKVCFPSKLYLRSPETKPYADACCVAVCCVLCMAIFAELSQEVGQHWTRSKGLSGKKTQRAETTRFHLISLTGGGPENGTKNTHFWCFNAPSHS